LILDANGSVLAEELFLFCFGYSLTSSVLGTGIPGRMVTTPGIETEIFF